MIYGILSFLLFWICEIIVTTSAATPNADPKYGIWPHPDKILYYVIPDFDASDLQVIQSAMNQISLDSSQCIKFQRYDQNLDAGKDYIYISNKLGTGRSLSSCYTFPGRSLDQQGRGQYMVMFSSRAVSGGASNAVVPGACLDNIRDAMKQLFHVMGFRGEYGRTDRVNYLDFTDADPNNLVVKSLTEWKPFRLYQPGEASFYNLFDSLSITMVDGRKWAKSFASPVFTPKTGVWIGGKPNLSQQDCQALALYHCDTLKCQNPYALGGSGEIKVSTINNPIDANGICFPGQTIHLASLTASGLSSTAFAGESISGVPVMERGVISGQRAPSPYVFSIVGSNPYGFQIVPDANQTNKANVVLTSAARGFTNVQITVQASQQGNLNNLGQTVLAMNLNCGPVYVNFPPGSPGTSLSTRLVYPASPIKGITCDGNLLNPPYFVGSFMANDPDNEPLTYYLTQSTRFQISLSGVLIVIQAPTVDLPNLTVNVNALDANGAVSTLYLTVPFVCS